MDELKVKSTSPVTAECSDIVLRETSKTRIIFRPVLVRNEKQPDASVKGSFIYQMKGPDDEWIDRPTKKLTSLKKGESHKLHLSSSEILFFYEELHALYKLFGSQGIPKGETEFIKANSYLARITEISPLHLQKYLEGNETLGATLLSNLLEWAGKAQNLPEVLNLLVKLGPKSLNKLNMAVGIQSLRSAVELWETNILYDDEEFWQKTLRENHYILSNIFPVPVILVEDKAYVGGKTIHNVGANLVDFLCKNELTDNAVLIEIKTPCTPLLSGLYRGIYNVSNELSGASLQVANYRHNFSKHYNSLVNGNTRKIKSFIPTCVVIIGNASSELDDDTKQKSFELFRNSQRDIQIITYDELFGKVRGLVTLLESGPID